MKNNTTTSNAFSYKILLECKKRRNAIFVGILDLVSIVSPVLLELVNMSILDFSRISTWLYYIALAFTFVFSIKFFLNTIFINSDFHDAYIPRFLDHISSFSKNKFNAICKEIHHKSKDPQKDILLYDAHATVKDILAHLTYLVHDITGVDMENISVNFIYKYIGENEHWQTIDGTSSCSIGTLDKLVNNGPSTYHYLYANNHEYVFFNDKAAADWHIYSPSMRDGEDRKHWGSIYCKRILCTLHQERIVDCILGISTYNEKFCNRNSNSKIRKIEHIINDAVNSFQNLLRIEMASLYLRHDYIKNRENKNLITLRDFLRNTPYCCRIGKTINRLTTTQINNLDENTRKKYLANLTSLYKQYYHTKHPSVYAFDANRDAKEIADILYQCR